MGTPLKDRETFLSQGIESNIACSICDRFLTGEDRTRPSYCFRTADEFSPEQDTASRILTTLHNCHGVYCEPCLLEHLKYNNTCPVHTHVILFELPRRPEFVSGERSVPDTIDGITDEIEARKFVSKLVSVTKQLYDYEQIFDSDIREKIKEVLDVIAEGFDHKNGLIIKDEHMAGVMDVAREIVMMHFKNWGSPMVCWGDTTEAWVLKFREAVGWKYPVVQYDW
ncbi:hypothetical protein J4E89_008552 [Alternaria sp. Ai002NY15]|nr:hypothetical protein J4E89_008552 [Alternaria sp. Ai002NY15]